MRQRFRPAYSDDELARIYPKPWHNEGWGDHTVRIAQTIALAHDMCPEGYWTVADLSCGDASIAQGISAGHLYLGDFAPGYPRQGMVEDTIESFTDDTLDLFILTETLEHVDDPDALLRRIRVKSKHLLLSTPLDEVSGVNHEHYWVWGFYDIAEMLREAGWTPVLQRNVYHTMDFQIWGCR
jgi:hypothetical protein